MGTLICIAKVVMKDGTERRGNIWKAWNGEIYATINGEYIDVIYDTDGLFKEA